MTAVAELSQQLHEEGAETQPAEEPCRTCGAKTVEAWVPLDADGGTRTELLFQFCEGPITHQNLIN